MSSSRYTSAPVSRSNTFGARFVGFQMNESCSRSRRNVEIPAGISKRVRRVESRLHGFPCFPHPVISNGLNLRHAVNHRSGRLVSISRVCSCDWPPGAEQHIECDSAHSHPKPVRCILLTAAPLGARKSMPSKNPSSVRNFSRHPTPAHPHVYQNVTEIPFFCCFARDQK
jgi:hypothetical protein